MDEAWHLPRAFDMDTKQTTLRLMTNQETLGKHLVEQLRKPSELFQKPMENLQKIPKTTLEVQTQDLRDTLKGKTAMKKKQNQPNDSKEDRNDRGKSKALRVSLPWVSAGEPMVL